MAERSLSEHIPAVRRAAFRDLDGGVLDWSRTSAGLSGTSGAALFLGYQNPRKHRDSGEHQERRLSPTFGDRYIVKITLVSPIADPSTYFKLIGNSIEQHGVHDPVPIDFRLPCVFPPTLSLISSMPRVRVAYINLAKDTAHDRDGNIGKLIGLTIERERS